MNAPYINASFLRGFSELILAKGGNPASLYEAVGLNKTVYIENRLQPGRPGSMLIPFDKFIHLLETAARELAFPDVAMQLARQQDIMILAPVAPMLNHCANVLEALNVITRYLKLLVSGYQVNIQTRHDTVRISFSFDLPYIERLVQYQDYALASAVNIINGLLGKSYPLNGCEFLRSENNRNRIDAYRRYFGCPVAFNCQSLQLSADITILQQDIRYLVRQFNVRMLRALSARADTVVQQVMQVISFSLASGNCGIRHIAASMNTSPRTLQRRLLQNDSTFSALLDAVRFGMANQYLQNSYYRMTDIALLLGYANLSAFSRSYQRWSGLPPSHIRRRHATKNPGHDLFTG